MIELIISLYFLIVFSGWIFLFLRQRYKNSQENKYDHVLLEILVPRNTEEPLGPLIAEQLFGTLHSIYEENIPALRWFSDVQPHLSFELANTGTHIHFYVWVRSELKELIESQIYAQYPEVEIYPREDFLENVAKYPTIVNVDLKMNEPYIYPIKKYKQFQDSASKKTYDSISGMVSALSKLNEENDSAFIQIIIRPVSSNWYKKGLRHISLMHKTATSRQTFKNYIFQFFVGHPLFIKSFKILVFPFSMLWATIQFFSSRESAFIEELEKFQRGAEMKDDTVKNSLLGKVAKLAYEVTIRVTYASHSTEIKRTKIKALDIAGSFKQFNLPHLNGFKISVICKQKDLAYKNFATRRMKETCLLNVEELASIFHLPILSAEIPNIAMLTSKALTPPPNLPRFIPNTPNNPITLLGKVHFREQKYMFGLKENDRRRHIYIIGKTGMGKSTLLENMIYSDVQNGKGVAVIDPHGDLAEKTISFVPASRTNDIVIFDPSDTNYPLSFNMLENVNSEHRSLIASGLVVVFKKLFADSWGPRLEYILRNTILALLEYPNSTMMGIMRILVDADFRDKVIAKVTDPMVQNFWITEFNRMQEKQRLEAISPIQNKVGQFLSSQTIRNMVGQPKSSFGLRWAMDKGKILVINLSKGKIGEDNSALLGAMLITKFQLEAMSRADTPEQDRRDFYLYVDEFQNFATEAFATILSEARKYKLNLTMANQYISQMPEEVRNAVFGNVGSMISFQVGFDDADFLSSQFGEEVKPNDLTQLPRGAIYTRILVDNMPTKTFSAQTMPPPQIAPEEDRSETLVKVSRERYAKSRDFVEEKIKQWTDEAARSGKEKESSKPWEGKKGNKPAKENTPKVEEEGSSVDGLEREK